MCFGIDTQKYNTKKLLLYLCSEGGTDKLLAIPTSKYFFKLFIEEEQGLIFALSQREGEDGVSTKKMERKAVKQITEESESHWWMLQQVENMGDNAEENSLNWK